MREDQKITITIGGQERNLNGISKAYTHAGIFHADDVCTTALLCILGFEGDLNRINNNEVESVPAGSLIFDIGGGEFDHHVKDKLQYHEDGCPKAAFSLIAEAIRIDGMTLEETYPGFTRSIAKPIDARDNGYSSEEIKQSYFAEIVNPFNTLWNHDCENPTKQFWLAVSIVTPIMQRILDRLESVRLAESGVRSADVFDGVMVLNQFMPWQDYIDDEVLACAYPSIRGGWNIQLAPVAPGSFETKAEFQFNEFQKGITTFVHPNGFLCACKTKEDVYKLISAVKRKEQPIETAEQE